MKENELVLVFAAEHMDKFKLLPGYVTDSLYYTRFNELVLPHCEFKRRGDVEDDPSYKQVIPYIVVRCGSDVLVYQRKSKGGDPRLASKWALGFGGHINPEDNLHTERLYSASVVENAAIRELHEELGDFAHGRLQPHALLYYDTDAVGRVHVGIVFTVWTADRHFDVDHDEIQNYLWTDIEDLEGGSYDLEKWSQLVVDYWGM